MSRSVVRPLVAAGIILLGIASTAGAQTLSLSQEEKEHILAGNTEASVDAARAGYPVDDLPGGRVPGIHGEMGAMIGSNGSHAEYGIAAIPLGANAGATVSFENSRFGYGHGR